MSYEQFICAIGFESVGLAREFHARFVKNFRDEKKAGYAQLLPPIRLIDAGAMYDNAGILYFEDNEVNLSGDYKLMVDRFMDEAMEHHPEVFGRHIWVDEDKSTGDQEFIPRDDADWAPWACCLNDIFTHQLDANSGVGNGSEHEVEVWHNGKCIGVRATDWMPIQEPDGDGFYYERTEADGDVTLQVANDGNGLWSAFCNCNKTNKSLTIKDGIATEWEAKHIADGTWAWRGSWESMVQLSETVVPR